MHVSASHMMRFSYNRIIKHCRPMSLAYVCPAVMCVCYFKHFFGNLTSGFNKTTEK